MRIAEIRKLIGARLKPGSRRKEKQRQEAERFLLAWRIAKLRGEQHFYVDPLPSSTRRSYCAGCGKERSYFGLVRDHCQCPPPHDEPY